MSHVQPHFHENGHTVGRYPYVRLFRSHVRNSGERVSEWQETMYIYQPYARSRENVAERVTCSGSCGWFEWDGFCFQLGIREIFTEDADLSGILESRERLKVSKGVHKASIKVDEKGSEAAAAAGIIKHFIFDPSTHFYWTCNNFFKLGFRMYLISKSIFGRPKFQADHPFVFYIWDSKSKTTIFMGRITNPSF